MRSMMTEFDRKIGFSVTRSSFHFNLSMRWFKNLILLFKASEIDSKFDTGSALAAMKKGNELSRYIEVKSVELGKVHYPWIWLCYTVKFL